MTLVFILPSKHLPNQRFSRKILTTLNAGVINWTWNLTPLKQGPKTQFLHSILFTIAYWNLYLQQHILVSTFLQTTYHGIRTQIAFLKRQTTHLAFLGETSRFTSNLLNLLPTKFLFVLSQSYLLLLDFIYRGSLFSISTTLIYHKVFINNKTKKDKQTKILVEQFTYILTQYI